MLTIEVNGEKKEIPVSWNEVTFEQFIALEKCGQDYVKIISLFTGIEESTIRKASIVNIDNILVTLSFLHSDPQSYIPEKILSYKIPKDLGFETIGQFQDLKDDLVKSNDLSPIDKLKKYALYCAIYACKEKHGEYDWEKSEWMAEEFMKAPCPEVLGIGNFTLVKLNVLKRTTKLNSRNQNTMMMRLRQALTSLRLRLGFTARSLIWKRERHLQEKSS